jgi:hypothetical protein
MAESTERQPDHQTATAGIEPEPTVWRPALVEAGGAFLAAAVLLALVYTIWFFDFNPEFEPFAGRDASSLSFAGLPLEERIRNNPIRCARRDDCFEPLLPYF